MSDRGSARAEKKAAKRLRKAQKKTAQKAYDRNHAQLKRQQAFHAALVAGQLRRNKRQAKNGG